MYARCPFCSSAGIRSSENINIENHVRCAICGVVFFLEAQALKSLKTGSTEAPSPCSGSKILEKELKRLQECSHVGNEVNVEWLPGVVKQSNGRKLAEEVCNDTIYVYSRDMQESVELVRHGFLEWILNQHTRPYLALINKLITLYEDQTYETKERIIGALLKML